MSTSNASRNLSRKALDPVFICMVVAMVLAVGSSLMLRAVAGPRQATAAERTEQVENSVGQNSAAQR